MSSSRPRRCRSRLISALKYPLTAFLPTRAGLRPTAMTAAVSVSVALSEDRTGRSDLIALNRLTASSREQAHARKCSTVHTSTPKEPPPRGPPCYQVEVHRQTIHAPSRGGTPRAPPGRLERQRDPERRSTRPPPLAVSGSSDGEMHRQRSLSGAALLTDDRYCPHVNLRIGGHVNRWAGAHQGLAGRRRRMPQFRIRIGGRRLKRWLPSPWLSQG